MSTRPLTLTTRGHAQFAFTTSGHRGGSRNFLEYVKTRKYYPHFQGGPRACPPRKCLIFGSLKQHSLHSDKTVQQTLTVLLVFFYTTFYDFLRTHAFECFLLLLETTFIFVENFKVAVRPKKVSDFCSLMNFYGQKVYQNHSKSKFQINLSMLKWFKKP